VREHQPDDGRDADGSEQEHGPHQLQASLVHPPALIYSGSGSGFSDLPSRSGSRSGSAYTDPDPNPTCILGSVRNDKLMWNDTVPIWLLGGIHLEDFRSFSKKIKI
jgi:hypothetical protein